MPEQVSCALLGQLLLAYGFITFDQLEIALTRQEASGEPLGEILVDMGAAQREQIERALRAQARLRGRSGHGQTFLMVVDDDPEIGAILGEILEGAGYRVGVAENLAEARAALRASDGVRPTLIVLDIGLPESSGIDFLEEIRGDSRLSSIPVIVLTGEPAFKSEIEERGLTFSKFLSKPVAARELVEAVGAALAESRQKARV